MFGMLNNVDLEFFFIKDENGEEVEIMYGCYICFLESSDCCVWEEVFKVVYEMYGKFKNMFVSMLSGMVKKDNFSVCVCYYNLVCYLVFSINNISEEVYDNLVKIVNDNLYLLYWYIDLCKKVLGIEEFYMYDFYMFLVKDVKMEVIYEEVKDYILKGLKLLGEDYFNVLKEGFENCWVDVYENKGKWSGVYFLGMYGINFYILMNW